MKLSELVFFKERLQKASDTDAVIESLRNFKKELELLMDDSLSVKFLVPLEQNISRINELIDEVENFSESYSEIFTDINDEVDQITKKFFVDNYETEFTYNDPENIRQYRKLYVPQHAMPVLLSHIGNYVDWRYPVLEIGCKDGDFTEHLVAGDPLYIVDNHQEFLDSTMKKFNPEYQRRLRPYLIKNHNFSSLPHGQFGFIFSWNYFNYMSLDSLKSYLVEIHGLLRPGGTMIFSYNNGDIPGAAEHAERYFMTYMPKSLLIPMCEMLGFEVVDSQDFDPAVSWMTIKKPGVLSTIKAHQVLGKIIPKT